MSSELPAGWAVATIADLFEVNPPKPNAEAVTGNTPVSFIPMDAVNATNGAITRREERSFEAVRKGYTAFANGDVILAKITPCFENGKAAVATALRNGIGFGSSEFHVFRPLGALAGRYLFHFVRQSRFRLDAAESMTGTAGQERVSVAFMRGVEIPIPPLVEQSRILEQVDALLSRCEGAKARLDRVPDLMRRFRRAVLLDAFSGRLTERWRAHQGNRLEHMGPTIAARRQGTETEALIDKADLPEIPDNWTWALLPELGELGRGRSRHRPRNDPRLFGGAYPFVQTGDVARSRGRITEHLQTYNETGLAQSRLWPKNTICITIAANIADSALLTYPACFPDSVVGLVAEPTVCLPEYAEYFVRTARSNLSAYAPATAQKNINMAILNDVAVPLPPISEQREIVSLLSRLFGFAAVLEERVDSAIVQIDLLPQTILSRAFSGALVPTEAELAHAEGREYETAQSLLTRVREKLEGGAPARGRGRKTSSTGVRARRPISTAKLSGKSTLS